MTTIKTPIKKIKENNVLEKIEKVLKKALKEGNAYTISGLMIDAFGVKEKDIHNKPFSDWPEGLPLLYSKIMRNLDKLNEENKVEKTKYGRAYHYWWKDRN